MKNILLFLLLSGCMFIGINYAQIPNTGFEDWETDPEGNNNPVGWQTTNSFPIITVEPYTPGYQGVYSMTVKTVNVGFSFPGAAYVETGYNFTQRPTKFSAVIKSNIMPGDEAYIMLALMQGDSAVAAMDSCTFKIDSTFSQFTQIDFPIIYLSNLMPDSLIVLIASGLLNSQVGTELTVDQIGFIYGSTDVADDENFPQDFELFQNYPNPFNPSTNVRFRISEGGFVSLKVYDVMGNEAATLVNEYKSAGSYEVEFDIHSGLSGISELSSGIYFYRLQAGSLVETKKMLLLK